VINPACCVLLGPITANNPNSIRCMAGYDYTWSLCNKDVIYPSMIRHNGGENWGLVDGHAKWYLPNVLYYAAAGDACAMGQPLDPSPYVTPTTLGSYQAWFDAPLP
jgi:prepilin-type processing-associated H-X9-DG protein